MKSFSKPIKLIFAFLFIAYLFLLAYLTFFSHYFGREIIRRSINIIPLKTINEFLNSGYHINIIITNLVGNIAAFLPMGFLLPIVFNKLNTFCRVLIIVLFGTLFIEISQYIAGVGASDIDDIILNLFGGVLGFCIYKLFSNNKR